MLSFGLLIILFGLCCAQATPFKVALDWYLNPAQGPLLLAQAEGLFAKQGLAVTFMTPTQLGEPEKLVLTGQADIAISYPNTLLHAQQAGLPLVQIGRLFQHDVNGIVVLAGSHITELKQLEGKRLGYAGDPSGLVTLRRMLEKAQVSLTKIQLVNVNMNLNQALLSHHVSAVWGMSRNVEPVQLQAMGYKVKIFTPQAYGLPDEDSSIFIARKNANAKANYQAFFAALAQAVKEIHQAPTKTWQIVADYYPQALASTAQMRQVNQAIWLATVPYLAA